MVKAMDSATTQTIRIGKSSIGLIGLDVALNKAAAKQLSEDDAEEYLFGAIREQNYIPEGAEEKYRKALRKTYHYHLHPDKKQDDIPIIRIYGKKCVSCDKLQDTVREVVNAVGLATDIEKIHEPDEIGRAGILITPALVINGEIKSSGAWPTQAQVEQWIKELKND